MSMTEDGAARSPRIRSTIVVPPASSAAPGTAASASASPSDPGRA